MILNVDLVDDYTSFLINGVTDDENQGVIEIDFNQVPSLESITINHVEVYKQEGSEHDKRRNQGNTSPY